MVKKVKKYLKFVVCCVLIMSLIAPSYAALSASDGSAFVTKAEFDSALADFNARLTTFEAGINSKIDSQVTSYLDRNGIWNGADQEFWNWDADTAFDTRRAAVLAAATGDTYAAVRLGVPAHTNVYSWWSSAVGAGSDAAIPLVKNISKSGLLAYNIPIMWFFGNSEAFYGMDNLLTFIQTDFSNLKWDYSQTVFSVTTYVGRARDNTSLATDPILDMKYGTSRLKIPYSGAYWLALADKSKASYFSTMFTTVGQYIAGGMNANMVNAKWGDTSSSRAWEVDVSSGKLDLSNVFSKVVDVDSGWYRNASYPDTGMTIWQVPGASNFIIKNGLEKHWWSGSEATSDLTWNFTSQSNSHNTTILSGYTFVTKGKTLLIAPGSGVGHVWTSKTVPITTGYIRTSGATLQLMVY